MPSVTVLIVGGAGKRPLGIRRIQFSCPSRLAPWQEAHCFSVQTDADCIWFADESCNATSIKAAAAAAPIVTRGRQLLSGFSVPRLLPEAANRGYARRRHRSRSTDSKPS